MGRDGDLRRDDDEGDVVGFAVRVELFETSVEADIYMSASVSVNVCPSYRGRELGRTVAQNLLALLKGQCDTVQHGSKRVAVGHFARQDLLVELSSARQISGPSVWSRGIGLTEPRSPCLNISYLNMKANPPVDRPELTIVVRQKVVFVLVSDSSILPG